MIRDQYIQKIADKCGLSYDALLGHAGYFYQSLENDMWGNPTNLGTHEYYKDVTLEEWEIFWKRYERICGSSTTINDGNSCPFTCSC